MKRFSIIIAILLSAALAMSCLPSFAEEEDETLTAAQAAEAMGLGWNLGNSFDSTGDWIQKYTARTTTDFETAWGNPVTPSTLMKKLKDLGFATVRIPITWRYHFDSEANIDAAWMDRVQEVVDSAMEAGLYCIINVHHDTGADGWLRATQHNYDLYAPVFARLWEQIAERFSDYPEQLMFEGFNEMLDDSNEWNNPGQEAVDIINAYNQLFVDTVRATGWDNETRNLICATYAAANTEGAVQGFRLPEDVVENHLLAEVHFYTPYEFITNDGITWTTPISKYSDYVEGAIDAVFARLGEAFDGIPLVIGEFATDDKGNTQDRISWYTRVIRDAKQLGAPCVIWDNGNGYSMGLIDRVSGQDAFPEIVEACVSAMYGE